MPTYPFSKIEAVLIIATISICYALSGYTSELVIYFSYTRLSHPHLKHSHNIIDNIQKYFEKSEIFLRIVNAN